VFLRLLDYS